MARQPSDLEVRRRPAATRAAAWVLANPTVPALLLAATVQVIRQALVDFGVFVGAALVIWRDGRRWTSESPPPRPAPLGLRVGLALAVGILAFADLVGHLPRTDVVTSAALGLPGVLAAVLVLRTPRRDDDHAEPAASGPRAPTPTRWRFAWALVAVALAVLELAAFLSQADPRVDNPQRPTVSALVEPQLESPDVRTVVIAVWLAIGAWLIRRVRSWMREAER